MQELIVEGVGASGVAQVVPMTHMSVVEKAIAMKKGDTGVNAFPVVDVIGDNKVTLKAVDAANGAAALADLSEIQIIAWGY